MPRNSPAIKAVGIIHVFTFLLPATVKSKPLFYNRISIFFVVLFSFIFSTTVTKIEPTNIRIGDDLIFNLTVEDYDSSISHDFYFNDFRNVETELNCTPTNSTLLNCKIEEILYTNFVN